MKVMLKPERCYRFLYKKIKIFHTAECRNLKDVTDFYIKKSRFFTLQNVLLVCIHYTYYITIWGFT